MENAHYRKVGDHYGGGDFSWQQMQDGLIGATSTYSIAPALDGAETQLRSISPMSSGGSNIPNYMHSYTPMGDGSVRSSPKKRGFDASDRTSVSPTDSSRPDEEDRVTKRQRNTEAARRYRQRKVDRVAELEEALASMTKERDDLRVKLARSEAETDVLRGLIGKKE